MRSDLERRVKQAVSEPDNAAKTGRGVPCCNTHQMCVVRHQLVVEINPIVGRAHSPSQHTKNQKIEKRKIQKPHPPEWLSRALSFERPGVTQEQAYLWL